jgi:uncharacterized protein YqhQ
MKAIGGQAVIEGVMFKSRKGWAVAVRDPKGNIRLKSEPLKSRRLEKVPLFRGFFVLFHTLMLGIRALEYSAQVSAQEEKPISPLAMALTVAASFALAVALFLFLPLYVTKLLGLAYAPVAESGLLFNFVDGVVRVFLFLVYVWGVGLWKEMGRVFEYHGAEHKVIHAYEAGDLSKGKVSGESPRHPRCGTSFLLIVMVISILVFSLIPKDWSFLYKFLSRVVLIPVIAGVSYELLKLSDRMKSNPVMGLMILPGLALQRLTTREPDEGQIEVALAALERVLAMEEEAE